MSPKQHEDAGSGPTALGTVVRQDARGVLVLLDAPPDDASGVESAARAAGGNVWCAVRGRVHLEGAVTATTSVAVGDRVRVRRGRRGSEDRGAVEEVLARRSVLARPDPHHERRQHVLAANVDQVIVVASAAEPPFGAGFVDRVLVVAEWSRLAATIVVNKRDLVAAPPVELDVYRRMGYATIETSALLRDGVEDLARALVGRVSVVTGHSGVGKSSLLNAIQPGLGLTVGAVNEWSGRGRQTTTAALRIAVSGGGAVIDTPGIREFGLFNVPRRELTWLFRDLREVAPRCKFNDCLHASEPGCAVPAAIESGAVAAWRFDSYLRLLETAPDIEPWQIAREGQKPGGRPRETEAERLAGE